MRVTVASSGTRPLGILERLEWSEVVEGLAIPNFTIRTMPARVETWRGDPLLPVLTQTPDLLAALEAHHAGLEGWGPVTGVWPRPDTALVTGADPGPVPA